MERNLSDGSVLKNIVRFSLPYLLSYFLQTLYGMADLFIIGQFGKVRDITAVSIGSQIMHMLTVMIVGLAMGSTVAIGRAVGGKSRADAEKAIGNTVTLFAAVSIVVTAVLLICINPIISVMSTPGEAVRGTYEYLMICFIGIPFITAYNVISSVLRGMGDSKSPMYFIAAACAANIVLDYVFMGALKLGPAGAALGTTLSQTISVIIALTAILKKDMGVKPKKSDFLPDGTMLRRLLSVGLPVALQDGFIQISFIVITIIANKRGLNDAAAVGIVEKIIGMLFLVPSSMLSSVSALAAQNIGAGKPERARLTLRYALCFTVGFGIIVAVSMQFLSEQTVALFGKESAVITPGGQYLRSYATDCIFAGMHFCFSGYFCALGKSGISFLHNVLSMVLVRVPAAYYASAAFPHTLFPMGLAAPLGSLLSVAICIIAYVILCRKETASEEIPQNN